MRRGELFPGPAWGHATGAHTAGPTDSVPGWCFYRPCHGVAQLAAQVSQREAPLDRVFTGLWWTGHASCDRPAGLISIISRGSYSLPRHPLSELSAGVKWRLRTCQHPLGRSPWERLHRGPGRWLHPLTGQHTLLFFVHREVKTPGALNTSEQRALWGLMTVAGSEFRCKEEKKSPWGGPNAFGPERNPGRELLPPFQGRASPLTVALLPHARRLRPVWEHGPFSGLPKSQGACGCRGA